jgi:ABC-type lipoprotein export system ATPase subunit
MPSQQRLIQLRITRLKNLVDVTIEFEEQKRLTAILGPNGFGKSTVLHALAASFKPTNLQQGNTVSLVGEDCRYIDYFPNTPHGTWSNTLFNVVHFFREGEAIQTKHLSVSKGIRQWIPLAKKRPERETYFIGVSSSIPAIELDWPRSKVNYTTHELSDIDSLEIRQKAGYILNRDYTRYHTNRVTGRSSLIGVEFQGVNYSALSMGAGEQRLFRILRKVKNAGKYALILIDELDLLLHTDALHRLLQVLNEYATTKNLQIVFTTHRESVVNFESFIAIRHLYRSPVAPHKTFCFKETKPDALARLTGQPHRPLSVCCEDDVSTAIVEKVAQQAGVRRFVEISRFGAADNCFTLAAALLLSQQDLENSLLVLDGDKHSTAQEREARMKKALTGDAANDVHRRQVALSKIVQYCPQGLRCPEQELHAMVISVQLGADLAVNEVITAALNVGTVAYAHHYVDNVIASLGDDRSVGLRRIVDVAAKSPAWGQYVVPLKAWFDEKHATLVEVQPHQES